LQNDILSDSQLGRISRRSDGSELELLKSLRFQLTVTRAMLKTLELEQILYIILSGITHGDGLNFNRALLFLAWDRRNELRVSQCAGPESGEDAHRIWEGIKAEKLDLPSLIDRYATSAAQIEVQALSKHLAGLSIKLDDVREKPTLNHIKLELKDVLSQCVATRAPIILNGVEAEYYSLETQHTLKFKNFACVPIFLQDEVFGVIFADNLFNLRLVNPAESRGLSTVANLASIALERTMLYRRLSEMVKIDGLTGVYNRSHYAKHLQEEYMRAQRLNRKMSMLVFDIDHFKSCNDNFGHERGDKVLQHFAQILKSHSRDEDMVARYGGEEFVILVTGSAGLQEAYAMGEKLRHTVESTGLAGFAPGQITTSVGVASIQPDEALENLFARADLALYAAKRSGRNCTRVYENSLSETEQT
jgi:diguanylate cyclase (GGDEF)-like protein